jgi:cell division septation protein DedD
VIPTTTASPAPSAPRRPAPAEAAADKAGKLTAPPAVYWVQVGAFQDPRNAERLVERLRGDGLPAAMTTFEQSRVQYRVLLVGEGGSAVAEDTIGRVRGLGLAVESTPDGPAVGGLVALRRAVEISHTLRQGGVRVRLKQEVGSSTFRVVRVGSFPTSAEAEATLATLTSRGVDGVVVRER